MSEQEYRTIQQLVSSFGQRLEAVGIDAGRVEVEIILSHLLSVDRLELYLHGAKKLDDRLIQDVERIVSKRESRYPLQFILGEAWFYGRKFLVNESVMIPTPETELLCDAAKQFVRAHELSAPRILDIGTGSGVIAVTLANEIPNASIMAVDLSASALAVAKENAHRLGGAEKIDWRESDLLSAIRPEERFDLILSNPPYISEDEYRELPPEVLADPKLALTSGSEGLDAIAILLQDAPAYLNPRGRFMFEIGYNQREKVAALSARDDRYTSFDLLQDLNGIDRVIILGCE